MNKNFLLSILAIPTSCLSIIPIVSCANDKIVSTSKDFVFTNEGTITDYKGNEKDLVIPKYIQNDEGNIIQIKKIGNNAFEGKQLTSIVIPDSVEIIGNYAFSNNKLTSVTIPSSVKGIFAYAFYGNEISQVTLPSNCDYDQLSFPDGCIVDGGNEIIPHSK